MKKILGIALLIGLVSGCSTEVTTSDPLSTSEASEWKPALELSGLILTKVQPNATWKSASESCKTMTLGGHENWRLPEWKELKKLYKDGIYKFTGKEIGELGQLFWSSSSHPIGNKVTTGGWRVSLYNGFTYSYHEPSSFSFFCVMGPKSDDVHEG